MFVHRTDLPANAGALFEGRPVSFEIDRTHRGRRAINIALISHSSDRGVAAEKANPMKPPLPRIESAVPRTLHAQLEIAKAVRTLTAPNGDDPQRQRGVEIAAIGQDLEALAREIPRAFKEASALVKAELCGARRGNTTPTSRGCRAAVEPRKQQSMTQSIQVGRLERQTAREVDSGPRMVKQMP